LQGLLWENCRDGFIRVTQAIWEGRATEPKTRRSKGAVPVVRPLAQRLEMYRLRCGEPENGPVFRSQAAKPMNLNNLLHREILPALNRCKHCLKSRDKHTKADHDFERDASLPRWRGWHAARRGLGSNLYTLGVPDKVIQDILRHANVNTTNTYYIKTASEQVTDAMAKLERALPDSLTVN
jgi:integrase